MRGKTAAIGFLTTLGLVLGAAGAANATSIDLTWVDADGNDLGSFVSLSVSETAVLDVAVDSDAAGVTLASISVTFNPSVLQATAFTICPADPPGTGNQFGPGSCGDISNGFGTLLAPIGAPSIDNVNGIVNSVAASTLTGPGQTNNFFSLATISFHALGAGATTVNPFFRPGVDGITDGGFNFSIPPTSGPVTAEVGGVVPEPGTFALAAVGLTALAILGRRRD